MTILKFYFTHFHSGWKGTKERICSRKKKGVSVPERKSCSNLCRRCGHDVRKKEKIIETHCNCTFEWCCEVKCFKCNETVIEYYCS